jgi:isoamylase
VLRRRSFFTGRLIAAEGVKDVMWIRPDGLEMSADDWADAGNHVLGMLVDGHATDELDERGRPIYGDTLLLILNAGAKSRSFEPPQGDGNGAWQEIINTARTDPTTPHAHRKGQALSVAAHSLLLLRWGEEL